ncbi:MAG: nucleotidyltransferase family protein, partial [Cupriavidus sp.]|nr:nucleotidyltransferase family protein [Cupriavidus sp.]
MTAAPNAPLLRTDLPTGILLAAGFGRRFDTAGKRNKLLELLPGGRSVAWRSARTLTAALPES